MNEELFATVCFLTLMEGNGGLINKHPGYIEEKRYLLASGIDAFAALDHGNQKRVVVWAECWKVPLPEKVVEYFRAQEDALDALARMDEQT